MTVGARLAAAAGLSLAGLAACGSHGAARGTMPQARAALEAEMLRVLQLAGAAPAPLPGSPYNCRMGQRESRLHAWRAAARLPLPPGAATAVRERVGPDFRARGWRVTDWSDAQAVRLRLARGETSIMVAAMPDGRGDLVLGGVTACFDAPPGGPR